MGQWLFEEGCAYYYGLGSKKENTILCQLLIEAAASSGFLMAVAYCHLRGWNDMDRDMTRAFELCVDNEKDTNGYHWSQFMMGICCRYGCGTERNLEKAFEWHHKSAEQENGIAMHIVAFCYENGQGVAQSCRKAFEWYEKSAALGDSDAMYNLGCCYDKKYKVDVGTTNKRDGSHVVKNMDVALQWYRKASALGNKDAKLALSDFYQSKAPKEVAALPNSASGFYLDN